MKAHIIKSGVINGLTYNKDYVYSVSEHKYNVMANLGMVAPLKTNKVEIEEVKPPKKTKPKKEKVEMSQMVSIPAAEVTVPGVITTKEEKFQNPTEE